MSRRPHATRSTALYVIRLAGCLAAALSVACTVKPEPIGSRANSITNGAPDDGDLGVVALLQGDQLVCTGTLVTPRVVVTAGHCIGLPDHVFFGAAPASSGEMRGIVYQAAHPDYDLDTLANDIGVVLLDAAAPADATVWPMRTTPLQSSDVGAAIRIVGYGLTSSTDMGPPRKNVGTSVVAQVLESTFAFDPSPSQDCKGDSGGPVFMTAGGVESLAGVVSNGDSGCTQTTVSTRVDVFASSFVQAFIDASAPGAAGLGGRCYDDGNCASGSCLLPADAPSVGYCTAACASDGDCPEPMRCGAQAGGSQCRYPSPSPGALGASCARDDDCDSLLCAHAANDTQSVCSTRCFPSALSCPASFECRATDAKDVSACFPAAGGCSMGGNRDGEGALVVLLMIWALLRLRPRRAEEGR